MKTIDNKIKICTWKQLHLNKGTTFRAVEYYGSNHPLYPCIKCEGYNLECKGYKETKK